MSLEYEIDRYIKKIKKSIELQKNLVIRDFLKCYLPSVNISIFTEDEEELDNFIEEFYYLDHFKPINLIGSAS
ncbi:MAG: hypothetical protein ACTSYR_04945 [Candidatus Odinarchaeia archaeon]